MTRNVDRPDPWEFGPWDAVEHFMAQSEDIVMADDMTIDDAVDLLVQCGDIEGAYDIRVFYHECRLALTRQIEEMIDAPS